MTMQNFRNLLVCQRGQCVILEIKVSANTDNGTGNAESRKSVHLSIAGMMAKGTDIAAIFCLPTWGGSDM